MKPLAKLLLIALLAAGLAGLLLSSCKSLSFEQGYLNGGIAGP
jgi:hypothetical protein